MKKFFNPESIKYGYADKNDELTEINWVGSLSTCLKQIEMYTERKQEQLVIYKKGPQSHQITQALTYNDFGDLMKSIGNTRLAYMKGELQHLELCKFINNLINNYILNLDKPVTNYHI